MNSGEAGAPRGGHRGRFAPHLRVYRTRQSAAERVLDAVEATFEQLTRQPESGAANKSRNRNLPDVRMFPVIGFAKYLVFC